LRDWNTNLSVGGLERCYGDPGRDISEILPDREGDGLADGAGRTVGEADDTNIAVGTSGIAPEEFLVGSIKSAEEG
jgi:hypothetical protein